MPTYFIRNRGRAQGPFDEDQLRAMTQRGQFSRVYEVSEDGKTWNSAQGYSHLFSAPSSSASQTPANVIDSRSSASLSSDSAFNASSQDSDTPIWHYEINGKKFGPEPAGLLNQYYKRNLIDGNTSVWREGMVQWTPIKSVAELNWIVPKAPAKPKFKSRPLLAGLVGAVFAFIIVAPIYYFFILDRSTDASSESVGNSEFQRMTTATPQVGIVINDIKDNLSIQKSVGFVVCGFKIIVNGKTGELPIGTGSCFAVTPDGSYLTNKHVVEDIHGWMIDEHEKEKHADQMSKVFHGKAKIIPHIWVFVDGVKHDAKIIHLSDDFDFGILKVNLQKPVNFHALYKSGDLDPLTEVYASGYPDINQKAFTFSDIEKAKAESVIAKIIERREPPKTIETWFEKRFYDPTISKGVTQGKPKDISDVGVVIQHQAKIHSGNSGGPLMLSNGTVVGINTWANELKDDNRALTIRQLRKEIDQKVPHVVWK